MAKLVFACIALVVLARSGQAGPVEDCNQERDLGALIRGCTALIEQDPSVGALYHRRGVAYLRTHQYGQAIADLNKAVQAGLPRAYYDRGHAHFLLSSYDRAIEDFTRAIPRMPRSPDGYIARGCAYQAKGDPNGAIADFTRALHIDPKTPGHMSAVARPTPTVATLTALLRTIQS